MNGEKNCISAPGEPITMMIVYCAAMNQGMGYSMNRPHENTETPPPTTPKSRRFSLLLAVFLAVAVSGCLDAKRVCRDEVVLTPAEAERWKKAEEKKAKKAHYRREYEKNRPIPPDKYSVLPKRRGDNSFAEFSEERFEGLDAQPELPPLPQDRPAPGPGAAPSPFAPRGTAPDAPGISATLSAPVPADAARPRRTSRNSGLRPAGIQSGAHFHPVEQLVYGGEYPDLDKPELYRLMPKDVITVTVKDHPEFSGQAQIQPDGTVRLPNTPDLVRLRGLTAEEAAQAVRDSLAGYVKGECLVRVQANRARGGYYYVFGDVLQPGRFPMGIEPIRLSEAILAANWEANPSRLDADGDELGPAFPAAAPRGRYIAPQTADMAGVVLITPHRSQPARSVHDARSALLGMRGEDPVIRPGQIIVVPSLDRGRNAELGLDATLDGATHGTGGGFSTASGPARLPEYLPPAPRRSGPREVITPRQSSMTAAFDANMNTEVEFEQPQAASGQAGTNKPTTAGGRSTRAEGWHMGF